MYYSSTWDWHSYSSSSCYDHWYIHYTRPHLLGAGEELKSEAKFVQNTGIQSDYSGRVEWITSSAVVRLVCLCVGLLRIEFLSRAIVGNNQNRRVFLRKVSLDFLSVGHELIICWACRGNIWISIKQRRTMMNSHAHTIVDVECPKP